MTSNRRSAPRIAIEAPVRVDGPRGAHHVKIRDLSLDGMFIESGRPYPAGTRLECTVELAGGRIALTAEVCHQSNTYRTEDGAGPYKGMGTRFVRLGADGLQTLSGYLARLTSGNTGS